VVAELEVLGKMNKKAQFEAARKTIYWMIAGVVIAMVVLGFAITIATYKNKLSEVPEELDTKFIAFRFTNSEDCLTYQDPLSGRVIPGMIDINKFTIEQLNKCYLPDEDKGHYVYNFGFQIEGREKFIYTNNFYNDTDFTMEYDILLNEGGNVTLQKLTIWVQKEIP
jgi:hypothetical protein